MSTSQLTIKQCYDDDGLLRANDVPCDPFAEVSTCCGTDGSICVDNLHCINPAGGSVPGTCTFNSWVSGAEPACPCPRVYTANQTLDYRDGVTLCEDGGYCCGPLNFDCCNSGDSKAIISYGNEDNVIPATSSLNPTSVLSEYYTGLAVSTQSISRTTTTTTASETTSNSASVTSSDSGPINSSIPVSSDSSSSSPSDGLSTGAKAGIGVGSAAVVLIIIAIIAFIFLRRRRSQKQPVETILPPTQQNYDYSQYRDQPLPPVPPQPLYEKAGSPGVGERAWTQPSELDSSNISSMGS